MKKRIHLETIILLITMVITHITTAQITVDNEVDNNAMYSDLQDAVNAASAGDTIYVHSSVTTYGNISITKPINLIGSNPVSDPAKIGSITFEFIDSGSGTTIKGLQISSISTNGTTNLLIENNYLTSSISIGDPSDTTVEIATIRGNRISSISAARQVTITNNLIGSIISVEDSDSTVITQNIFTTTGTPVSNSDDTNNKKALVQNSIFIRNTSSATTLTLDDISLSNCLLYNYGGNTFTIDSEGSENISITDIQESTNPMFTSFNTSDFNNIDNDFTLLANSPALNAGLNSEEIGIMGNGFSYDSSLHPAGFPTVTIQSATAHAPENGTLQITFTGNSN